MKLFERPPEDKNELYVFLAFLAMLILFGAYFICSMKDKVDLNPYVLSFGYGFVLGYFTGRIRRKRPL